MSVREQISEILVDPPHRLFMKHRLALWPLTIGRKAGIAGLSLSSIILVF